jgi:D-arabinose 1-dehydrogenase-like Zn-dependent alcohol dehydrogenase
MSSVPKKSLAAVLVNYNTPLELQEVEILDPEPRAIIAKIDAATICGTDVHMLHGQLSQFSKIPLVMGHEMVGRVVKLGKGRERDAADQPLKEGDRIVWAYPWCGECYYCTIALQPTQCRYARMYGWGSLKEKPYLTGGFSEYVYVMPKCHVVKVPDEVESSVASAATCAFRTVIHNFERLGGLGIQEKVLILGCGPIGLFAVALAVASGAAETAVIGAPQARLDLAKKWGANLTINIEDVTNHEERKEMIKKWADGRGPDVVVECAGPAPAFAQGLEMVRSGGRYIVIGQSDPNPVAIHATSFNLRQVEVGGALSGAVSHFYKAMQFLKNFRHRFNFEDMVANSYPLSQVNEALTAMAEMKDIKPVILPNQ